MLTADVIRDYLGKSKDQAQTNRIRTAFGELRKERNPMYLTILEVARVEKWFLRSSYDRFKDRRRLRTEDIVRNSTQEAFFSAENEDYGSVSKSIQTLCAIPGVGIPTGSAILALTFPERHCVISNLGYKHVFGKEKSKFTEKDYFDYLTTIRQFAIELNALPQEVDLAIWAYDRENPHLK